jgi:hypothetical protein
MDLRPRPGLIATWALECAPSMDTDRGLRTSQPARSPLEVGFSLESSYKRNWVNRATSC